MKNSKESCIEMGKSYQTRDGKPVRILCVNCKDTYCPVIGLVDHGDEEEVYSWTSFGMLYKSGVEHGYDLVEVSPYDRFKMDDPIWVRRSIDDKWRARHFAGIDEKTGLPLAWDYGYTSHSAPLDIKKFPSKWYEAQLASEFTPDR